MVRNTRRTARSGSALPLVIVTIVAAIIAMAVIHVLISWREAAPPDPASGVVVAPARDRAKRPAREPDPAGATAQPIPAPAARPKRPAGSDRDGVEELVSQYAAAVSAGDAAAFSGCYDLERMLTSVEKLDLFPPLRRAEHRGALTGMREALERSLGEESRHAWSHVEIRRLQELPDPDEVEVRFRVRETDGPAYHGSWWLSRRSGSWKIYDAEDSELGARHAVLLGAAGAAHLQPSAWTRAVPHLEGALRHLLAGEFEEAVSLLDPIQGTGVPEAIEGLRRTLLAVARAALGDLDAAERDAATAVRLRGEAAAIDLVRATVANGRGAPQDAIAAALRYEADVGTTARSSLQLGLAQRALGRSGEAIKALRAGLADDPGSTSLLFQLALTLPRERAAELAGDFAAMPDPDAVFESLALDLLAAGANEAVVALAQQQRVLQPGHENAPLLAAEAHLAAGRPAAAAGHLREALSLAAAAQRPVVQARLADALMQDGRPIEAYAALPDPGAAFTLIADRLAERGDGAGLAALVAEVRERTPADPSLPYYSGRVAELNGHLDEAARIYLKALREAGDETMRRRLHRAAVTAMYRGGAMTKAYEVVPPRHETAELLAQLAAKNRDARALQRIFDAHTQRAPEDKAWRRWGAELAFLRGDYLAAKIAIDPLRGVCLEREDRARWYDDRMVRTLIRLKRFDDAQRAAREATGRRDGDPLYEFVANAVSSRFAETVRLARRLADLHYDVASLYHDEDCGPALRNEPVFAPFREAYPPPTADSRAPALAEQVWVDPDR